MIRVGEMIFRKILSFETSLEERFRLAVRLTPRICHLAAMSQTACLERVRPDVDEPNASLAIACGVPVVQKLAHLRRNRSRDDSRLRRTLLGVPDIVAMGENLLITETEYRSASVRSTDAKKKQNQRVREAANSKLMIEFIKVI
jgi:hypothetical protein